MKQQARTTIVALGVVVVVLAAGGGLLAHQNSTANQQMSVLQAQLATDRAAAAKVQADANAAKARAAAAKRKADAAAVKARQAAALVLAQKDAAEAQTIARANVAKPRTVIVVPAPAYNAPYYNASSASATLNTYFDSISSGDYYTAYSQLDSNAQARQGSLARFRSGLLSSVDTNVVVNSVNNLGGGRIVANVSFHSHQDPDQGVNPGETDTNWNIDYTLVPGSGAGGYLIHSTANATHSAA